MQELTPKPDAESLNDRDLLRRFLLDSDEAAFAEIVQRHQGLVMGVCRRVIGNTADVDDAFQATFIALARRPKQIRKAVSLSSWLYTVAWRTSVRLVRQRRKHPVEELTQHPPDRQSEALDKIANAQDCVVLDEELNFLPSKYREVLVMTYFANQTSQQIADQLNVSKGTVDGRIRQARNILRVRLARRGVAIGVLAVAATMSIGVSAAASPALLQSTLQLGAQTLSGSVPGTTDLSHLEPLIRPETVMASSKLILGSMLCATAVVGLVAANGAPLGMGDDESPKVESVESVISEDSGDSTTGDDSLGEGGDAAVTFVAADLGGATTGYLFGDADALAKGTAKFKPYPADARPVEKWMHEVLDKPVKNLDFPGQVPLSEILETISTYFTSKYGEKEGEKFAMAFHADKAELSILGLDGLDDVLVSDIDFDGMTLRNALKLIFDQTNGDTGSTEPLTYVIKNEVMLVTSLEKAESEEMLVTRVYRVGELLNLDYANGLTGAGPKGGAGFFSIPANAAQLGGGEGGTGMDGGGGGQPPTPPTLATLVMEMTSPPCRWLEFDGEGGAIRIVGQTLVVRQTPKGHKEVVRLLNLLYESAVDQQ